MHLNECPPIAVWTQFANGDIEESKLELLSQHLLSCKSCLELLDKLSSNRPGPKLGRMDFPFLNEANLEELEAKLLDIRVAESATLNDFVRNSSGQNQSSTNSFEQPVSIIAGRYKLVKKIGEGGMGTVWEAEQINPVRRLVALKMIRTGMNSKNVLARFDAERQALAMMEHQNIAKVLDAGQLIDDRPFFVMELVHGTSLTKYCDSHRLSVNQRLELLVPICEAIQHAHQKGVVHRDLKPSNILVLHQDGKAVPKVIDFGLAKALQDGNHPNDKSSLTEFGQIVGTLQYMSPEQAELNPLDIDTRTDIYSLGAILYELLIGSPPIETETIAKDAIRIILHRIREDSPQRPSSRLSCASTEAVSGIAGRRQIESSKLQSMLAGELDWIVMKALEKDRSRRYGTATGLAEDITRFLEGDPVHARPPSNIYRIRKYIQKNRSLFASLCSTATALILATIISTWFGLEARKQKKEAEEKTIVAISQKNIADQKTLEAVASEQRLSAETKKTEDALDRSESTLSRTNLLLARSRWNEGLGLEALELLFRVPPKHRNLEWALERQTFERTDCRLNGNYRAECIAYSPDGQLLAVGASDYTIKIWSIESHSEIATFQGHRSQITSVTFSPDGKQLATGSIDSTIRLWDLELKKERQKLVGFKGLVNNVVFSPNGSILASAATDKTIRLWDLQSGKEKLKIDLEGQDVKFLLFSPNGKLLASPIKNSVTIWEVETGTKIRSVVANKCDKGIWFAPDGNQLTTVSRDGATKIWDVRTGSQSWAYSAVADSVLDVAFSPDDRQIAALLDDGTVKLWDKRSGELISTHRSTNRAHQLAFSPSGDQLALNGPSVELIGLGSNSHLQNLSIQLESSDSSASLNLDGSQLLLKRKCNSILAIDPMAMRPTRLLKCSQFNINATAFSPDGKTFATESGWTIDEEERSTIQLWDALTGEELRTFASKCELVTDLKFSSDGTALAAVFSPRIRPTIVRCSKEIDCNVAADNLFRNFEPGERVYDRVIIWDVRTGKEIQRLVECQEQIIGLTFSPDNSQLAISSNDKDNNKLLEVWNVKDGTRTHTRQYLASEICLAYSRDGRKLVVAVDDTIRILDSQSGEDLLKFGKRNNKVECISFNSDESRLISGHNGKGTKEPAVIVWNSSTGEELLTMSGFSESVKSIFVAPSDRYLGCITNSAITVFPLADNESIVHLKGHKDFVTCVAVSPDAKRIASRSADGQIKIWDALNRTEFRTLPVNKTEVYKLIFSPNSNFLATLSTDKAVHVWDINSNKLVHSLSRYVAPSRLVFSPDSLKIYGEDTVAYSSNKDNNREFEARQQFEWDLKTGNCSPITSRIVEPVIQENPPQKQFLVDSRGNDVVLVYQSLGNGKTLFQESIKKYQKAWHSEQATAAEASADWFAATYHRAMQLKLDNSQASVFDALHAAYHNLLLTLETDNLTSTSTKDPRDVLSPIIRAILEIPRAQSVVTPKPEASFPGFVVSTP